MDRSKERGQIVVLLAMMLVVLAGVVALAVDLGQIYVVRRGLQNTADVAALTGSVQLPRGGTYAHDAAVAAAQANFPDPSVIVDVRVPPNPALKQPDGVTSYDSNYIQVTLSTQVTHFYAALIGQSSSTVAATAIAHVDTSYGGKAAIIALDENNDRAIDASGTGDLTVVGGDIWSNDGVCAYNAASITATPGTVDTVGEVQTGSPCVAPNVGPTVQTQGTPIGDPLAGLTPPACSGPNLTVPTADDPLEPGWILVSPGTYSTWSMNGGKNYKFLEGVYCISADDVSLDGHDIVGVSSSDQHSGQAAFDDTGAPNATHPWGGVTFYLNGGPKQNLSLNGATVAKLTPFYNKVLIWMVDSSYVDNTGQLKYGINKLNGNAATKLYGTIYAPKTQAVVQGNNGDLLTGSLIAKDITVTGTGNVNVTYDPNYAADPRIVGALVR